MYIHVAICVDIADRGRDKDRSRDKQRQKQKQIPGHCVRERWGSERESGAKDREMGRARGRHKRGHERVRGGSRIDREDEENDRETLKKGVKVKKMLTRRFNFALSVTMQLLPRASAGRDREMHSSPRVDPNGASTDVK